MCNKTSAQPLCAWRDGIAFPPTWRRCHYNTLSQDKSHTECVCTHQNITWSSISGSVTLWRHRWPDYILCGAYYSDIHIIQVLPPEWCLTLTLTDWIMYAGFSGFSRCDKRGGNVWESSFVTDDALKEWVISNQTRTLVCTCLCLCGYMTMCMVCVCLCMWLSVCDCLCVTVCVCLSVCDCLCVCLSLYVTVCECVLVLHGYVRVFGCIASDTFGRKTLTWTWILIPRTKNTEWVAQEGVNSIVSCQDVMIFDGYCETMSNLTLLHFLTAVICKLRLVKAL